jgi:hypothetical protein
MNPTLFHSDAGLHVFQMQFLGSEYLISPNIHVLHTQCTAARHQTTQPSYCFLTFLLDFSVLRNIFEPERKEVTGGWRKLRNGSFRIFTTRQMLSVDQIGKEELGGACDLRGACMKNFVWRT